MKLKKKIHTKENSNVKMVAVPVSSKLKERIEALKREPYQVDVNGMTRDFFEMLLKQATTQTE